MFKTFKKTAVCVLLAAIMLTGCSDTDTYGNETVDKYKYFYRLGNSSIVYEPVSYTHLRAHETDSYLVCRLLLEKKKKLQAHDTDSYIDYIMIRA